MKTLLTLLGVMTVSTVVHANTLTYDFRGDWQSIDYNEAAGLPDYTRFYLKTGRLYYKGTLNERFSYDLRLGYYKPAVETATLTNALRDSTNPSVEYANVTDKMSDMFSLTLGKFGTDLGGFEGGSSGAELYMVSPNYQHSAAIGLGGKNLAVNEAGPRNLLYMTGAKATLTFAETQNLYLIATNNIGDATDSNSKFNQNRGLVGALWKGGFMDKTLTGLLSYHTVSPQGAGASQTDSGDKHEYISAGIKYENPTWVGSLEYNTTTFKDGLSGNKDTLYSVIGKFGYKMEQWTPRLEIFSSEEKREIGASETNKFMGYGAVVEYRPTADNVRYHLAYNNITTKPASGDDKIRTEIVLGTRLLGDFLK